MNPLELLGDLHWMICSVGVVSAVAFTQIVLWRRLKTNRPRFVGDLPPISILKPFDGTDPGLEANFWSYCTAPYGGERQLVFATAHDNAEGIAVVESIRRRAADLPGVSIDLVLPDPDEEPWVGRKVWHMNRGFAAAKHDVILNADSGTRVDDAAIEAVVRTLLADDRRGVAWASYAVSGRSLGARLTRLAWTSSAMCFFVVDALRALTGRYGLPAGGLIAFRRQVVEQLDGFKAGDAFVTEDLELGRIIHEHGWDIVVSPLPVVRHLADMPFSGFWGRQLRWNVILWAFKVPARFPYPLVMGGLALVPFTWAAAVLAFPERTAEYTALAVSLVIARLAFATYVRVVISRRPFTVDLLWMLPLLDAVLIATWARAPFVKTVDWRGKTLRLGEGGRVE